MPVILSKQALKFRRRMQPKEGRRIDTALARLAENPAGTELDIATLVNTPAYRLRVGGWRVIFRIDGDTVTVTRLGPRGDIYKG